MVKVTEAVQVMAANKGIEVSNALTFSYVDGRIVCTNKATKADSKAVKAIQGEVSEVVAEYAVRYEMGEFADVEVEAALEAIQAERTTRSDDASGYTCNLFNDEFIKSSRREMLTKTQAVHILGITAVTKDGLFDFVPQTLAQTRLTTLGLLDIKPIELPYGLVANKRERATEDFMVVNFGEANPEMIEIRKYVIVYVEFDGTNTQAYGVFLVREDGKLIKRAVNLKTGMPVDVADIKDGAISYHMIGSTASGSRQGTVYYFKAGVIEGGKFNAGLGIDIDTILNTVSYGAWNKMINKNVHASKANKFLVRIFANLSANVNGGEIRNYAMYFGDMGSIGNNKQPLDGMLFNSIELAHSAMSALLGINASPAIARKFAGQVRPFTTKCFSKTLYRHEMNAIMDTLAGGRENIVVLDRDDITEEIEKELDNGFSGKGRFVGKLVVIGDLDNVQILTDTNGYKAPFDYTQTSEFTILDLPTDTSANTSIQLIEKLLVANKDKTVELIETLISEFWTSEMNAFENRQVQIPSLKDAAQGYVPGLIGNINPQYVFADSKTFSSTVRTMKTRLENTINKMKFPVDGLNARIHADYGVLFGQRFLAPDEVLLSNRHTKRLKKDGITRIIGIKYPSVGLKEYFDCKVVTAKTLEKRVLACDTLTIEQKRALISMYHTTNDGTAVIGAYQELKFKLAGLDFDFDMICFFFDKRIVEILSNQSEEIVSFEEEPATTKAEMEQHPVKSAKFNFASKLTSIKEAIDSEQTAIGTEAITNELDELEKMNNLTFTFNKNSAHNAFCLFLSFTGVNVGMITNLGTTQDFALLDSKVMQAMVTKAYGVAKPGARPYVGLTPVKVAITPEYVADKYIVNKEVVARIEEEIKVCAKDKQSLIKMFKDLNMVYRYYQELAIDAAKTFIAPLLNLVLAKGFRPAILTPATIDNPQVDINFDTFEADLQVNKFAKKYIFNDPLNQIRYNAFTELKAVFEELTTELTQRFEAPKALREYWMNKIQDNALLESLSDIVSAYGRLSRYYTQKVDGLKDGSPLKTAINREKEFNYRALRDMFVALTPEYTMQQRGSLAKALNYYYAVPATVGAQATFKKRDNKVSFAESIASYEYFTNVCKSETAMPYAGERIISGNINAGETVTLVNGIYRGEKGAAATTAKLNGEFTVIEVENKKYAVKPILEVMEVPATTNHMFVEIKVNSKGDDNKNYRKEHMITEATLKAALPLLNKVKNERMAVTVNGRKLNVLDASYTTCLGGAIAKTDRKSVV